VTGEWSKLLDDKLRDFYSSGLQDQEEGYWWAMKHVCMREKK
jgi:hypothetical protein